MGRAFSWIPGFSLPTSTSRPPTECEEDCQEEAEVEESLCEVFIHEKGNAKAELRFLDRFLRQVCLTIAAKVLGLRLVNVDIFACDCNCGSLFLLCVFLVGFR